MAEGFPHFSPSAPQPPHTNVKMRSFHFVPHKYLRSMLCVDSEIQNGKHTHELNKLYHFDSKHTHTFNSFSMQNCRRTVQTRTNIMRERELVNIKICYKLFCRFFAPASSLAGLSLSFSDSLLSSIRSRWYVFEKYFVACFAFFTYFSFGFFSSLLKLLVWNGVDIAAHPFACDMRHGRMQGVGRDWGAYVPLRSYICDDSFSS